MRISDWSSDVCSSDLISAIQPGQAIKTVFRSQPLFVRHLTPKEIAEADAVPLGDLRDPQTLEERTAEGKKEWLITMGVCNHLGCVPLGARSEEHTSELQSLIRISYAVFCLKKKHQKIILISQQL